MVGSAYRFLLDFLFSMVGSGVFLEDRPDLVFLKGQIQGRYFLYGSGLESDPVVLVGRIRSISSWIHYTTRARDIVLKLDDISAIIGAQVRSNLC